MVTNHDLELIGQFFLDQGIETDGPVGEKNGRFFGAILTSPITQEKLQTAFERVKKELVFANPVQAEYNRVVAQFTDYDRDFIAAKLAAHGFVGEDLKTWTITAKEFLRRGYQVTNTNANIVLGNLVNSTQADQLLKKPQPSKYNAQAVADEIAKRPKVAPDESKLTFIKKGEHPDAWVRPLTGVLKQHQDMIRSESSKDDGTAKQAEVLHQASAWETMTLRRLEFDVRSQDRWQVEPIIAKARSGESTWRQAYAAIDDFIASR